MNKTVGVITMYRKNYGAFLQGYALQQKLIALGYSPEMIRYDYYKDNTFLGMECRHLRNPVGFIKKLIIQIIRYKQNLERVKVFDFSIKRHIRESKKYYKKYVHLNKMPPYYDIYLTGSDQVFNPLLSPQATKSRLLCFAKNKCRVSYAASAGEGVIPKEYGELYFSELRKFKSISVREESLRCFIEDDYGLKADCHIDPTALLTKEEWEAFAVNEGLPQAPYILYYRIAKQKELQDYCEFLSEQLNLPVFVVDGTDTFTHQIRRVKTLSPEQWVAAFKHAAYVVTNSFHGTIFATIFHKCAHVCVPENSGLRITDFLNKCALNRLMSKEPMVQADISSLYLYADVQISREMKYANDYLHSIGVEENPKAKVYCGSLANSTDLVDAASGGLSTALARQMISDGGVVYGVKYAADYRSAVYMKAKTWEDLTVIRGSKYIRASSTMDNGCLVYADVTDMLSTGKQVLFVGLPCEVGALYKYLSHTGIENYSNLITVDLICHGPTYPNVQAEFIAGLEAKYNSKVVSYSARFKKPNWRPAYINAEFENGKRFTQPLYETEFGAAFTYFAQECCYKCQFKGENHVSDLTIGDYWGMDKDERYNEKGVSIVFVHTVKGEMCLNNIGNDFSLFEADWRTAINGNPRYDSSIRKNKKHVEFSENFKAGGLTFACKRTLSYKEKFKIFAPKPLVLVIKNVMELIMRA